MGEAVTKRQARQAPIQWCLATAYELSARCYRQATMDGHDPAVVRGILSAASQYEALVRAIRSKLGVGVDGQVSAA